MQGAWPCAILFYKGKDFETVIGYALSALLAFRMLNWQLQCTQFEDSFFTIPQFNATLCTTKR